MADDKYLNKKKRNTSRWLVIGVIVLAILLVLWLTIFEYWGGVEQGEHVGHGVGDGRVEIVVGVGSPCEHEAFGEVIGPRAQASCLCECRRSQMLASHRQDHNQSPSR